MPGGVRAAAARASLHARPPRWGGSTRAVRVPSEGIAVRLAASPGADVLERLALREGAEPLLVLPDVATDFLRVRPGVLPERPADGLAEEELPRRERGLDRGVEQLEIGVFLEGELAEDGAPAFPHVVRAAPGQHLPSHLPRGAAQQR